MRAAQTGGKMAADVVGYSRLMRLDESGTLARPRKNRSERLDPILTKYGGRLVKLTGDLPAAGARRRYAAALVYACEGQPALALFTAMELVADQTVGGDVVARRAGSIICTVSRLRRDGKRAERNLHLLDHKNLILPLDPTFIERCAETEAREPLRGPARCRSRLDAWRCRIGERCAPSRSTAPPRSTG